jgi:hypothetical protein
LLFTYTYLPSTRTYGQTNPSKLYLPIISIAIIENFSCAKVLWTAVRAFPKGATVLVEAVRVQVEAVRVLVEAVRVLVEAVRVIVETEC